MTHFFADPDSFPEKWRAFLQTKGQRGHAKLVAGDGTTLFVDFTATANYLPGRHILILCDVTERTHAELSLRKSEERFQLMANHIQEIFWMMNAETNEIRSPQMAKRAGLSAPPRTSLRVSKPR
jgi:PAS domain-containing protein